MNPAEDVAIVNSKIFKNMFKLSKLYIFTCANSSNKFIHYLLKFQTIVVNDTATILCNYRTKNNFKIVMIIIKAFFYRNSIVFTCKILFISKAGYEQIVQTLLLYIRWKKGEI